MPGTRAVYNAVRVSLPSTTRKISWPRLLLTLTCLTFIISGLFAVDGLSRERRLKTETSWPTVEARIQLCSVTQGHGMRSRETYYYVRCSYSYSVNGVDYKSHTTTTSTTQSDMMTRMVEWVHRHPKGQRQVIHYNPGDPSRVSLAGADHEIQTQTAEAKYGAARVMMMCGLGLLIAAFIANLLRESSRSDELDPASAASSHPAYNSSSKA
jgi:uncharacterized protein DUF3592